MNRNESLFRHLWLAVGLFVLLAFLKNLLVSVPFLQEGYVEVFFIAVLIVYTVYLIFIVLFYFTASYAQWLHHLDWITGLLKAYSSLFLFCLLLPFLLPDWSAEAKMNPSSIGEDFLRAVWVWVLQNFSLGIGLAFPASLYSLYLAVKSLVHARRKQQTLAYGMLLLLFSLMLLWRSHDAFLLILGNLF